MHRMLPVGAFGNERKKGHFWKVLKSRAGKGFERSRDVVESNQRQETGVSVTGHLWSSGRGLCPLAEPRQQDSHLQGLGSLHPASFPGSSAVGWAPGFGSHLTPGQ